MRKLFILAFIANVAVTLIALAVLPDRIATHFGADGRADGWAPNYVDALIMTGVHVLLFISFYFSPQLMLMFPAKWINLPNKAYWLQPAVLPRTKAMMSTLMRQFGFALFLFLLVAGLLSLQANMARTVRLHLTVFYPAVGAFLIYTVWWTIVFFRAFRLPNEKDGAHKHRHGTACRRP